MIPQKDGLKSERRTFESYPFEIFSRSYVEKVFFICFNLPEYLPNFNAKFSFDMSLGKEENEETKKNKL